MKITDDRTEFDDILDDAANLILLLSGGAKAASIYDLACKSVGEGWRKTVLIENISQLKTNERTQWALGSEGYVMIKRDRSVSSRGGLNDLCDQTGTPEILKIKRAFAQAE